MSWTLLIVLGLRLGSKDFDCRFISEQSTFYEFIVYAISNPTSKLISNINPPAYSASLFDKEVLFRQVSVPQAQREVWVYKNVVSRLFLPLEGCFTFSDQQAVLTFHRPIRSLRRVSLEQWKKRNIGQIELMASMAKAVADLHKLFIVHGKITYDSFVEVDADGDVRLWDFSYAHQALSPSSHILSIYSSSQMIASPVQQSDLSDDIYALFVVYFFFFSGLDEDTVFQFLPGDCRGKMTSSCAEAFALLVPQKLDIPNYLPHTIIRKYFRRGSSHPYYLIDYLLKELKL